MPANGSYVRMADLRTECSERLLPAYDYTPWHIHLGQRRPTCFSRNHWTCTRTRAVLRALCDAVAYGPLRPDFRALGELPGVTLGPTRVSLPGAVGFQLNEDHKTARPDAIVGGREFAHLHPDGSLHASLSKDLALEAIQKGWAVAHPWADQCEGWEGFVMIYSPTTEDELNVVIQLIEQPYHVVTFGSAEE